SCKGLLAYSGLQRLKGQEPRCLGSKKLLPPNIIITEEDVVPPPPEDAKFVFIGVGVSVYNKEMLFNNRLPLVNGFSQLVVSKEEGLDEGPAPARNSTVDGDTDSGRRHRQPEHHPPDVPVGIAVAGRQGAAVPVALNERGGVRGASGGGEGGGSGGGRDQMEALVAYAVGRVKKQVDITAQVVQELTKLTPAKLREAAVVQANKVQEMPTLLADTSKRMVDSGTKLVQAYLDDQERKK
ncbi:unnamed protein product, partial [Hapterophycus canaliculatus]